MEVEGEGLAKGVLHSWHVFRDYEETCEQLHDTCRSLMFYLTVGGTIGGSEVCSPEPD